MTTGEDHGAPWVPPAMPDIGSQLLDVGPGCETDCPGGGGNLEWEQDPLTDIWYRGVTEDEMEANDWPPGTLLMIVPSSVRTAFRNGASTVLDLPLAEPPGYAQVDLPFVSVDVEQHAVHERLAFTNISWDENGVLASSTDRPTMRFYLPTRLDWPLVDDVALQMFAASTGGGLALVGAATDRTFALNGPYAAGFPTHLDVPVPVGNAFWVLKTEFQPVPGFLVRDAASPGSLAGFEAAQVPFDLALEAPRTPALAGTCADGLDNDKDTYGDGCDFDCVPHYDFGGDEHDHVNAYEYTKNFALVGDAAFCARHPGAWQTMFMMWGGTAEEILNQTEAPSPYAGDVRTPPFRAVGAYCFGDFGGHEGGEMAIAAASACHLNKENCPSGHEDYPFAGAGWDWGSSCGPSPGGYMQRVWNAVEIWAEATAASDLHPIHAAVAVLDQHDGFVDSGIRGKAYADFYPHNSRLLHRGASLVLGSAVDVGARIAHEIGHTMGLAHDSVYLGGHAGFMRDTVNAAAPVLDWDAPSLVPKAPQESSCATGLPPGDLWTQGEVWAEFLLDKRHPRPSGFKFRGCSQTGCSSAHPLLCNGGSVDMCIPGGS